MFGSRLILAAQILGVAAVAFGAGLVYFPAGFIVGGLLLVTAGELHPSPRKPKETGR